MRLFKANDEKKNRTDQLAIHKHDREVERGPTEKQLQLSGQSGTWTRDHGISSRLGNK